MDETSARHVQIHGRSLRVFEAGDGDPVVLLHGGGADSSILSWGDVFDPLSHCVHLYAFDWPGYGRSEPIDKVLTGERLVDTLEALIDYLRIARVNLVGISMGGEAALGYAFRHPERVRRLVLLGCGGLQERAPYHAIAWPLLHLPLVAKPMMRWQWHVFATKPRLLGWSLRSLIPSWDTIPRELVRMIQDELSGRPKPEVFSEWQADEVRFRGLKTNWTPRLAELSMPVKILHGDRDFAVPVRYARRAATLIPNVHYREYEGCGHWLPRERPADVVREIAGCLTE